MILWRAADDDYIAQGFSFSTTREIAEEYMHNRGYGGANLYRTSVRVHPDSVLDLTGMGTEEVADLLGEEDPGAIGLEEWLPTSAGALDAIRAKGYLWVKVDESFPPNTVTWIWSGTTEDDEPELIEIV